MQFDVARHWYQQQPSWLTWCLLPLSFLFRLIVAIRRFFYRCHLRRTVNFSVPVIVVGNIVAGGAGKTPFVIWLAEQLREQGYRPGIVSRGVGGVRHAKPHVVECSDKPASVGDEALLLRRRAACPVVLCVDRVAAVKTLLAKSDCDVVISDDGLQHYRMGRQLEIAVVDGDRRCGNGYMLPAGPLREPVSRLDELDFVVVNGGNDNELSMQLRPRELASVANPQCVLSLDAFIGQTVHAVAGIGHPERFFNSVKQLGCTLIPHAYPDHYAYQASDITFQDRHPVLMTEKDAVKCAGFANDRCWYLRVSASIANEKLIKAICQKIKRPMHE